jgi:hypothetical protein
MKTIPWILGCLLVGLFAQRAIAASDGLSVVDSTGFKKSLSLSESDERVSKTLSIVYPGAKFTLGPKENGTKKDSDTLTIPIFRITLKSDADVSGPDIGESASLGIAAGADSDLSKLISDALAVVDTNGFKGTKTLTESDEAGGMKTLTILYPGRTIVLGPDENNSDTLTIPAFTATLVSDFPEVGVTDIAESARWSIGISASSDTVPEPTTWAMMLIGFAGLGYVGYRRSRKRSGAVA